MQTHPEEKFGSIQIMSSLSVQLYSVDNLVFLQEVRGILCQERVDLTHVVSLGQFYSSVPLIQVNTAVYGLLYVVTLKLGEVKESFKNSDKQVYVC